MAKKLYVGGLAYASTEATMKEFFAQAGTVTSASVITDRDTGRSKGFGFIEMSSDEEAAAAISTLNGKELDGRKLTVSEAKPRAERPAGGNRGGYSSRSY
jgi:cold-inducible RNA-binding protein